MDDANVAAATRCEGKDQLRYSDIPPMHSFAARKSLWVLGKNGKIIPNLEPQRMAKLTSVTFDHRHFSEIIKDDPINSVCCDDMVNVPRVQESCGELHPFAAVRYFFWGLDDEDCTYNRSYENCEGLGLMLRSMIGCYYYVAELVLSYLPWVVCPPLLSPLFLAHGCSHYDSFSFGMACSVIEIVSSKEVVEDGKIFKICKMIVNVRYLRPVLRRAAVEYALESFLSARFSHQKVLCAAGCELDTEIQENMYIVSTSNHLSWTPRGITADSYMYDNYKAAKNRERYFQAWESIQEVCCCAEKIARRLVQRAINFVGVPISIGTQRQLEEVIKVPITGTSAPGTFSWWKTDLRWTLKPDFVDRDTAYVLQKNFGYFGMIPWGAVTSNCYIRNDDPIDGTTRGEQLREWIADKRIVSSPSYSPTLPMQSLSPRDAWIHRPLRLAEETQEIKEEQQARQEQAQPRNEDVGDVVFAEQLAYAKKLSLEDQKRHQASKRVYVELSETETDSEVEETEVEETEVDENADPILAQSPSLDYPEDFKCPELGSPAPGDEDQHILSLPKIRRIMQSHVTSMNGWAEACAAVKAMDQSTDIKFVDAKRAARSREAHRVARMSDL